MIDVAVEHVLHVLPVVIDVAVEHVLHVLPVVIDVAVERAQVGKISELMVQGRGAIPTAKETR